MFTEFNDQVYSFSENVSDFLIEHLNDQNEKTDEWGYDIQKIENPKIIFFEQRVAALEGGVTALAVKSFNKAKLSVIKSILQPGDNIVTYNSHTLYFKDSIRLNRSGIEVKLSEDGRLSTFERLIDKNTKLIYLETISQEYLNIPDFQKISIIAKIKNIPILVDNTSAGPGYLSSPLKNGANIVIESTKNWLHSHKSHIGAVIVDGGNYNWQNGNHPQLNYKTTNGEGKNDIPFSIINHIKKEGNINISPLNIPEDPLSLVQDLEHLPVVIQRQSDNALKLTKWLQESLLVDQVNYTGHPTNPDYFKALRYFTKGFGAELAFTFIDKTHHEAFQRYISRESDSLKFISSDSNKVHVSLPALDFEEVKEIFENAFDFVTSKTEVKLSNARLSSLTEIF